jgi:Periplasmic component of the Tol biopolymer transport system
MMRRLLALSVIAALSLPAFACGQDTTKAPPLGVRIGLNYAANGARPGIVFPPIEGNGDSLGTIISRDLDYSDRMTIIPLDSVTLSAVVTGTPARINYALLTKFGASVLIRGSVIPSGVRIRVYDVAGKKLYHAVDFALPPGERDGDWRFRVHGISDEIELWLLGIRGIAQTRIAFVHDGQIKVVDSDGEQTRVLRAGTGSLSPAWSYDGRRMVYSVLGNEGTEILEMNLGTGEARRIPGSSSGLNITPVFSPDGKSVIYSHGGDNGSDLVIANDSGSIRHLTFGNGADNNAPSFSPDGRQITFVSDRSGLPQVYIMDADGTNMQLLAGYDLAVPNYRASPDWSPTGQAIAYEQRMGDFQVWMIDVRDRVPKQLTLDGENEDPSWAPDGRHLVLSSTRGGTKQLWVLDSESGRYRQLTHSAGARLSAWSPILMRRSPTHATP